MQGSGNFNPSIPEILVPNEMRIVNLKTYEVLLSVFFILRTPYYSSNFKPFNSSTLQTSNFKLFKPQTLQTSNSSNLLTKNTGVTVE